MRSSRTAACARALLVAALASPAAADEGPAPAPAPPPPAPPARARLLGRVLERGTIRPLAGAAIRAGDRQLFADEDGRFALELPPGESQLLIAAAGYQPMTAIERLAPGARREVEYRLLSLPGETDRYRSTVRGGRAHQGERISIRPDEFDGAAGTGGDPLRVVGALPGVIPLFAILPIYSIRGASPGMSGYLLDGMRVPQVFHDLLVDPIVHPAILDHIDFYPGSYDVTFGHVGGGVIDVTTRAARRDAAVRGEVELKIPSSLSGLLEVRLPDGASLLAAGRYGNPSPVIGLVQKGAQVEYGDYQLRADWRGLTVEAVGSSDSVHLDPAALGLRTSLAGQLLTVFHRIQVRERARLGPVDLEVAVVGGLDRVAALSGQGVQKLGLSARLNASLRLPVITLQVGLDGEASRFRAQQFEQDASAAAPDQLGELAGDRDGLVGGAYVQGALDLQRLVGRPLTVTAGVRADVYHAGTVTLLGIDPRLTLRFEPLPILAIFGGLGVYQQPPSFPIPLPGLDTFALRLGLQRALSWSAGAEVKLAPQSSLRVTAYYGRFTNINDVVIDYVASLCTSAPPDSLTGLPALVTRQLDGTGFGLEVLARGVVGPLSGWLSYTLSRAERHYTCGLGPADVDQTHVVRLALSLRLPWRLRASVLLSVSTGKPYTRVSLDADGTLVGFRNNARLPDYGQLDLRLEREWVLQRFALLLYLEVLNATASQLNLGVTYDKDPLTMVTRLDRPVVQGFQWLIPILGVRATF